ncbi:hypothetical protein [Ideonella sp.]|uniref:hypothetical protein n=1 Tax=Ideonella sp. TaxID=1929293 RepID=UPI0035B2AE9D
MKKLLGDIVGGETSGKHAGYADELVATGKPIVGYVCNPLNWYLTQWKLGCAGKGDIHKRLTDQDRWDQLKARRANRPLKDNARPGAMEIPEGWNAEYAKATWYADAESPDAFREWLKAILANKAIRRLVDPGYAGSPINKLAGLMTYHLFMSFVRGGENVDKSIDTLEALEALGAANAITAHFIRAESIGADLLHVLTTLGIKLTEEQRAAIDAMKDKGAGDVKVVQRFYDVPSLRMVAKRDELISKLFGYTAPPTVADADSFGRKPGKNKDKADKPAGTEGAKLSKAEKEQKRLAREQRQARKAAKGAAGDSDEAAAKTKPARAEAKMKPANAKAAKAAKTQVAKPPKPAKAAKSRRVDDEDDE